MRHQCQLYLVSYAQNKRIGKYERTWDICEGSLFNGESIDTCKFNVSLLNEDLIRSHTLEDDRIGLEVEEDQAIGEGDIDSC